MPLNLKQLALVVGVSIVVSFLTNFLLGNISEADVWRKTALESIYRAVQLEGEKQSTQAALQNMTIELQGLENDEINAILKKYLSNGARRKKK